MDKLPFRVGLGYDVHAFCKERPLILGGVNIAHHQGLLGHSDADVLSHAITDALLGALALGDIGQHFPDDDPAFKNADSLVLLAKILPLIKERGYQIGNIDAVIQAQAPKLAPHIKQIRASLAQCLNLKIDQVSVKATTTEKLGFVGKEEGMACQATALLYAT